MQPRDLRDLQMRQKLACAVRQTWQRKGSALRTVSWTLRPLLRPNPVAVYCPSSHRHIALSHRQRRPRPSPPESSQVAEPKPSSRQVGCAHLGSTKALKELRWEQHDQARLMRRAVTVKIVTLRIAPFLLCPCRLCPLCPLPTLGGKGPSCCTCSPRVPRRDSASIGGPESGPAGNRRPKGHWSRYPSGKLRTRLCLSCSA